MRSKRTGLLRPATSSPRGPRNDGQGLVPARQIASFVLVGLAAAIAHYGALIALVEAAGLAVVPAPRAGYVVGGVVSYVLNRMHTFESGRAHREALWRFVVVAAVGFGLTGLFMALLVGHWAIPYLVAQAMTTGIVLVWSFLAHKMWTFAGAAPP